MDCILGDVEQRGQGAALPVGILVVDRSPLDAALGRSCYFSAQGADERKNGVGGGGSDPRDAGAKEWGIGSLSSCPQPSGAEFRIKYAVLATNSEETCALPMNSNRNHPFLSYAFGIRFNFRAPSFTRGHHPSETGRLASGRLRTALPDSKGVS